MGGNRKRKWNEKIDRETRARKWSKKEREKVEQESGVRNLERK